MKLLLLIGGMILAIGLVACRATGDENVAPPTPTPPPYCYLTFFDPRGDYNDVTVRSVDEPSIIGLGKDGVVLRFGPSRVKGAYYTAFADERDVPSLRLGMMGDGGFYSIERLPACGGRP